MSGKHEIGCDCRDCMTYLGTHISVDIDEWMPDDASSAAFRTRNFEPRLINNVESLVDHATGSQETSGKHGISCHCPACMTYVGTHICVDIDQWMPDDASLAGFGTRDAPTTSTVTTKATILTTPQKSVTTKATNHLDNPT